MTFAALRDFTSFLIWDPRMKVELLRGSMSPMRGDFKRKCSSVLSWEEGVECIQPSVCSGETLSLRSVASGPGGRRFVLDGFITRWWSTATVLEATQADGSALVCQPWSYLRLKAYSFLGLCEGAYGDS